MRLTMMAQADKAETERERERQMETWWVEAISRVPKWLCSDILYKVSIV